MKRSDKLGSLLEKYSIKKSETRDVFGIGVRCEHCNSLQTDLRLIKNASRLLRYDWATSYYGTSVVWWLTGKRFKTNARLWIVVLLKIKTINNIVGLKKAKRPKQVFKKKKLFFGLFTNGIVTLKQNKSKEQFINRSC